MEQQQPDYEKAWRMALSVLDTYEINTPPVPIIDIVKKEGFSVMEADFSNLPNPNLSGFVVKNEDKKTIYVNREESFQRKRFTVAHEFGHWLLGHTDGEKYVQLCRNRSKVERSNETIEREANFFAANLLIPRKFLCAVLDARLGMIDNIKLAELFSVSIQAMQARREFLGL